VNEILRLAVGLLPVILFLAALTLIDSYKLVTLPSLIRTLVAGMMAAGLSYGVNRLLVEVVGVDPDRLVLFAAPMVEEVAKAAVMGYLFRTRKIGFGVDAAIRGFAVGTGFALVENVYYSQALGDTGIMLWVVRGLGTAIMHGSATAIFALVSKTLVDRRNSVAPYISLPGLAAAVIIHGLFNQFLLPPLLATLLQIAILPVLVIGVFDRSERATRSWLGLGFDADAELMELIRTGGFSESHVGRYLTSLREQFPGPVVGDMVCMLQIHLELSLRAKGILLAREAGIDVPVGPEIMAQFEELEFLEKSLGRTGMLAVAPVMAWSRQDLWQLYMLKRRHESGSFSLPVI